MVKKFVWCFVEAKGMKPPFLAEFQTDVGTEACLKVGKTTFRVPRDAVSTTPYTQADLDKYAMTKKDAKRSPDGDQSAQLPESPELKKYKKAVSGFFK